MLLLLPISRYRVEYQVAAGRPYSIFEQLILRAIHQGTNSVSALGEIFQVHPRLILEALVTLTQAGWLAVGGPDVQGFKLTSAGEEAFSSGREPRSRNITSQRTWIVMERLTGALINEGMVRYLRTNQVTDMLKNALKISEQVHERKISEAQIDSFLPRDKNEWLYRINSIDLKSRQAHWLPTTLDVTTLQFDDNLPLAWRTRVGSALIEAAQRSPQFLEAEVRASSGPTLAPKNSKRGDVSAERVEPERCAVLIEETDLLSTDDEHIVYLQHSLREVRSKLLIASAFMRANCLEALTTDLMAALSRGVAVDVLWGYNSGRSGEADGMEILKKIAFDARSKGYRGKINYNRAASGSHAKIIIWDHADSFEVCIGSYNWLSVSPKMAQSEANESRATNLSVRLRSSAVVARLIRSIASLWSSGNVQALDATPDRWRRVASSLEELQTQIEPRSGRSNAMARLVIDFDHDAVLRTLLATAQRQLLVISHKLGVAARTRLVTATGKTRSPEFRFAVLYGQREVEEAAFAEIEAVVTSSGGTIDRTPGLHAKAVIADETVCLGSYNFLSTDIYGKSSRTKELSVILDGADVAGLVCRRLGQLERN